jgi:riboflavin kinase / FMN adenylyltransferase
VRVTHGLTDSPRSGVFDENALTIGNFDGLHRGHQALLARVRAAATKRGLRTAVVTFEPHPREFFAPASAPPRLHSLTEKLALLRDAGVDHAHVLRFDQRLASLSPETFVSQVLVDRLRARWVIVGDDFRFGAKRAGDFAALHALGQRLGFETEAMPTLAEGQLRVSSSAVRNVLAAGRLDEAAILLGRPYSVAGRVMHGDKIGRTLGFPTANVRMVRNKPAMTGTFAVEVHGLGPAPVQGAASVGVRPSVTTSGELRCEVFLLDFDANIYGKPVRVDFLKKISDEEKYTDLPTLVRKIEADVEAVRLWFAQRHAVPANVIPIGSAPRITRAA